MHEPAGSDDPAAKVLADALVAQTNPKEGNTGIGEGLHNIETIPGLIGAAGTRRKEYLVGIKSTSLSARQIVVTEDFLLHPELAEILDQIVGEGVEIIDNEEHDP